MKSSILNSPFARAALRTLGMAPLDREFRLSGGLAGLRRILFVDSGQLSDLVFHLPLIAEIHRRWPEIELHVMVDQRWADLMRREPMLAGLLVYKEEQLKVRSSAYYKLLKEVKARGFDGALLMGAEADGPRDLVAYASQASLRIGIHHPERDALLNCLLRWRASDRYAMEIPCELARIFGVSYDLGRWRFELRPEEQRAADQLIHFRKPVREQMLIAVDPGHGKGERRVAANNLSYLVNHISERLRGKVLLLHLGEMDRELAEFRRLLRAEALDMPPQGLRELLALLTRCDLILAGNTELFHVGVSAGVPTLGLFTDADGKRWEPRHREAVRVLRGRPGEKMSLHDIDAAVEEILNVRSA